MADKRRFSSSLSLLGELEGSATKISAQGGGLKIKEEIDAKLTSDWTI
jgi:hypothetical protein